MNLKEKVPFFDTKEYAKTPGRVRLLGKLEGVENFGASDFNQLLKSSIKSMEETEAKKTVIFDDELEEDITKEDLLERHLSYRVEVREGKVANRRNGDNIVEESATFKIIYSSEAIEINGPYGISYQFKEVMKEAFNKQKGMK